MKNIETAMIEFRAYRADDRNDCLALFHSNVPKYFHPKELIGFERWLDGHDAGAVAYLNAEANFYYVLELHDKVIGCGGFYVVKGKKLVSMAWGIIANNQHKKGYGKALLMFRMEKIKELYPSYSVFLDTSQHTFQFFEKLGFELQKITKNAYGPGLDQYDMLCKLDKIQ